MAEMHSKQPPHDFRIGKQYIENTKKIIHISTHKHIFRINNSKTMSQIKLTIYIVTRAAKFVRFCTRAHII